MTEGASLMSSAKAATPSWQGASAQAFAAAAASLAGGLGATVGELDRGAGVLDTYAGVLERAHAMAAELRLQAARLLVTAIASPATAPACNALATTITSAFNNLLTTIDTAATHTATSLTTSTSTQSRNSGTTAKAGAPKGHIKGPLDWTMQLWSTLLETRPFSDEDIRRLREQADGNADWDKDANQGGIGDCYLLASLQGYSQTEEGQQLLRDHVRWDKAKNCFVVTLYDNGKPVYVEVNDYYSDGSKDSQGRPTLMSLYERAYGKYFGYRDLDDGGTPGEDGMEAVADADTRVIGTMEIPVLGGNIPLHKYSSKDWENMEQAVKEGEVVVGSTSGGDFSRGDTVEAASDTNGDGKIDTENPGSNGKAPDKEGDYRIVGGDYDHDPKTDPSSHAYTVVDIDDNYVTLRNPWGENHASGGSEDGGLIRITREDYEKYFEHTIIGQVP
ncbi:cysteine protease [Actinomyces viscosus]|uniref:C2 family cysteine protease n=1 Tax=Actinomyces viscosus TaxID=1656 RepID=UPI000F84D4A8|nr:C2 family cysteine protease [Actinomyces viscosus]TFH50767.1 cysteine protease [Actinomyces viscosus]